MPVKVVLGVNRLESVLLAHGVLPALEQSQVAKDHGNGALSRVT